MQNSLLREQVVEKFKDGHRITLRPSSIQQFYRCPYQWAQVHLLNNPVKPAAAARAGTAIHEAFEEGFKYKMKTQELPEEDVLISKAQQSWRELNEQEELIYRKDESFDKYENDIIDGVRTYHREMMPHIEPFKVEERFSLELDHPYVKEFAGTADLIAKGGLLNSAYELIDYKFTKRPTSSAHYMLQQNAYMFLIKECRGLNLQSSTLHNIVRPNTRNGARINVLEVDYKEKYFKYMINTLLDSITEFMENGTGLLNGFANPVDNYLCNSTWCGYWTQCPHVEGLRSSTLGKEVKI